MALAQAEQVLAQGFDHAGAGAAPFRLLAHLDRILQTPAFALHARGNGGARRFHGGAGPRRRVQDRGRGGLAVAPVLRARFHGRLELGGGMDRQRGQ